MFRSRSGEIGSIAEIDRDAFPLQVRFEGFEALLAAGTSASGSVVAGFPVGSVAPSLAGRRSPPIRSRCFRVAIPDLPYMGQKMRATMNGNVRLGREALMRVSNSTTGATEPFDREDTTAFLFDITDRDEMDGDWALSDDVFGDTAE